MPASHGRTNTTASSLRKPLTTYMRFQNERRPTIKNENPGLSGPQISALVSKEWKEISKERKDVYVQQYNADMEKYKTEKANDSSFCEQEKIELQDQVNDLKARMIDLEKITMSQKREHHTREQTADLIKMKKEVAQELCAMLEYHDSRISR